MTKRRPKWIRARVEVQVVLCNPDDCQACGRVAICDHDEDKYGYKPGDRVVVMSADEAREFETLRKHCREFHPQVFAYPERPASKKRRARP